MAKLGMLLDLTKCAGCYGCVVACKMQNGTRPGVNYNNLKVLEWGEYPKAQRRFLLTLCMHCEKPACVGVCTTGASYKAENGTVMIDFKKCIGCGLCLSACPYEQRHLIKDNNTSFPGHIAPYEEESSKRLNIVEKCTFCYERTSNGQKPACVHNCPGKCRIFGDVSDPASEISKYIASHETIKIEGTSIYYVIPKDMDKKLLPVGAVTSTTPAASQASSPKAGLSDIAAVGIGTIAIGAAAIAADRFYKSAQGGDKK